MAEQIEQFSARDAFIYTDTYRKGIKMNAANIATEKERLKARARQAGGTVDTTYYAELRAYEHAMNYIVKREEPRTVMLGELEEGVEVETAEVREGKLNARIGELQRVLSNEKEQKEKLKVDLKKVGEAYQHLQEEAVELRRGTARLRRKLAQTSNTFGVVGFAMFMVIVVLLMVLTGR